MTDDPIGQILSVTFDSDSENPVNIEREPGLRSVVRQRGNANLPFDLGLRQTLTLRSATVPVHHHRRFAPDESHSRFYGVYRPRMRRDDLWIVHHFAVKGQRFSHKRMVQRKLPARTRQHSSSRPQVNAEVADGIVSILARKKDQARQDVLRAIEEPDNLRKRIPRLWYCKTGIESPFIVCLFFRVVEKIFSIDQAFVSGVVGQSVDCVSKGLETKQGRIPPVRVIFRWPLFQVGLQVLEVVPGSGFSNPVCHDKGNVEVASLESAPIEQRFVQVGNVEGHDFQTQILSLRSAEVGLLFFYRSLERIQLPNGDSQALSI